MGTFTGDRVLMRAEGQTASVETLDSVVATAANQDSFTVSNYAVTLGPPLVPSPSGTPLGAIAIAAALSIAALGSRVMRRDKKAG